MTKLQKAKKKMEEARSLGKEGLIEELREIAEPLPVCLTHFSWRQYTDRFNDGDTCTFSVHASPDYGLSFNGEDRDELEESDDPGHKEIMSSLFTWEEKEASWASPPYKYKSFSPVPAIRLISEFLEGNEKFLQEALGDQLEVTYYRPHAYGGERVECEECDHD